MSKTVTPLSTFSLTVNPRRIPHPAIERILKHLLQRRVWLVLRIVHYNRDIAYRSTSRIPSRTVVFVFRHGSVGAQSWICSAPGNVSTRFDRVVEVAISKDGAMLSVPWTAESALSGDRKR
jgi:hypothetical protein